MVFFRDGQPLRIFTKKSDLSSARETLAALYRAKDIEKTVVRTFVYENDPRGRIVRFVDQGGTQFKVEYASTAVRL
jgi:hypothetical protein